MRSYRRSPSPCPTTASETSHAQTVLASATVLRLVPRGGQLPRRRFACPAVLGVVLLVALFSGSEAVETRPVMYEDPALTAPVVETTFPPVIVDRWLKALQRPEREMKRRAALSIADAAAKGYPGLEPTIEPLIKVLGQPGMDRIVRLTAARALVALDARPAVSALVEATAPQDLDMAVIVEPALARWKETALRERWMERLNDDDCQPRLRTLAIRGLVALEETEATARLRELAMDGLLPPPVRFEAADALGDLQNSGLLDLARQLCRDQSVAAVPSRIVAARMLAGHRGDDAVKQLVALAGDPEPSVAAIALGHLFRIEPALILPVIDSTVRSTDAQVRRWGAEALVAKPSPSLLATLVPMLDDPDPGIRSYVCDSLVTLAGDASLRQTLIDQGRRVLNADSWRGQQQATLLLVTLGDTTITSRLLKLLDVTRAEANVTAAWGLCQLAVPETAEPALAALERKLASCMAREPQGPGIDDQLAYLAQMFGVLRFSAADAALRKFIPKGTPPGEVSRAAAIWALGHLHADQVDERLADDLEKRLVDAFNLDAPESWLVCRMAAVSLGRMKARGFLPVLQATLQRATLGSDIGYASAWAIWQITGEKIPPLVPSTDPDVDWFLVPVLER